jgi:hypothetical protein
MNGKSGLTLRGENGLKVLEGEVSRKIFGLTKLEVTKYRRLLHNELHN